MRVLLYSTKPYDRLYFERARDTLDHTIDYLEARLDAHTARLAHGYDAVCTFVNDSVDEPIAQMLADGGTKLIALRCAGYNQVDLGAADRLGLTVVRVPAYSPHAVAEHTVAMMLSLNRQIYRAHMRVREGNFSLDGLLGFDMAGKTVGVIGTGQIGRVVMKILAGFGCELICYDVHASDEAVALGGRYVDLPTLYRQSDIVTLHCPLTPDTHHMIDEASIEQMKRGVMIVNTSRGALIDAAAAIDALKAGRIGHLGIDVYEEEADLFFEDLSNQVIQDDVLARLLTFPNVLVTSHQAYFTETALQNIAHTTMDNITAFAHGGKLVNRVAPHGA